MCLLSVVDPQSGTETILQALATAPADMHTAIKITCMVYQSPIHTDPLQLLLNASSKFHSQVDPCKTRLEQAQVLNRHICHISTTTVQF